MIKGVPSTPPEEPLRKRSYFVCARQERSTDCPRGVSDSLSHETVRISTRAHQQHGGVVRNITSGGVVGVSLESEARVLLSSALRVGSQGRSHAPVDEWEKTHVHTTALARLIENELCLCRWRRRAPRERRRHPPQLHSREMETPRVLCGESTQRQIERCLCARVLCLDAQRQGVGIHSRLVESGIHG